MAKQLTQTLAVPERVTAEHYKMQSSTGTRKYDLFFDAVLGRWICNCPDKRRNFNDNCKHRRRLVAWIAEQEQSSQVQREATEIAQEPPVAVVSEIADSTIYGMMIAIADAELIIKDQANRIICLECDLTSINSGYQSTMAVQDERINELERILSQALSQLALVTADIMTMKATKASVARQETAKATKPLTQEEMDRAAWEEFEKDPEAGRRAGEEKRRNAALGYNKPFSMER